MPSIKFGIQDLLSLVGFTLATQGLSNAHYERELFDMLLTRGAIVGECDLSRAISKHGTELLEYMSPYVTDFPTKAVHALAKAAKQNNFEAVEFLFHKGVDPHAFITVRGRSYSIQAVANQGQPDGCGGPSLEMMQFLARHGARLVVTPEDSTPFDFAGHLLRTGKFEVFAKIKYVLGTLMDGKTSYTLPAFLLESCLTRVAGSDQNRKERLRIFEYLYRQGAEVSPGSPLAALAAAGGREALVREVMSSGSDLNAYWENDYGTGFTPLQAAAKIGDETLVRLFLQEGADVNSPVGGTAGGRRGGTALQLICYWRPATEEEHRRKMRICHLLIDHGADINDAPFLRPALSWAALGGDLELAALLLREGADVNAPSRTGTGTALDEAAGFGRLDMVKFLLNANALSYRRGATGYDGVIFDAENRGRSAVADLIREHAAKVEAGTIFNPELEKPQKDYRIYYELSTEDESPSDDDYESSSEGDGEDMDAAGRTFRSTNAESSYRETAQTEPGNVAGSGTLSYSDLGFVLPGEHWPMDLWDEHIQPTDIQAPSGSWTGQVAANITACDSASHSGMGFVLPEEDWQMEWEPEHIVTDPSHS
ncbi:hypothetical protein N8I77_013190 [Diaporthe amygdali]|uniref:Ankyrin n=1 Tax=Phomopsis amygdali TaxID=1214568 RepID=A0AAD9S113_PHOAM|nr:hypothetical protein N8I77_013190 [Diaporthe amygdali]